MRILNRIHVDRPEAHKNMQQPNLTNLDHNTRTTLAAKQTLTYTTAVLTVLLESLNTVGLQCEIQIFENLNSKHYF